MITIPFRVRVGLVVLLTLVIAPTLSRQITDVRKIIPAAHESSNTSISVAIPDTLTDLLCAIISEAGLGTLFGVGFIAIFSGLQLAGEWLDRHSGLGLGAVFNPEWSTGSSACGSLARLLGCAALLLAEPIGGHWQLLQSLVQSFHAIPVGMSSWSISSIDFLNGVVQQCLILGIRVAMPLVAAMMLVDVTLAFAYRGTTTAESSAHLAIRVAVGLIVLSLTTTTIPDSITQAIVSAAQVFADFHLQ